MYFKFQLIVGSLIGNENLKLFFNYFLRVPFTFAHHSLTQGVATTVAYPAGKVPKAPNNVCTASRTYFSFKISDEQSKHLAELKQFFSSRSHNCTAGTIRFSATTTLVVIETVVNKTVMAQAQYTSILDAVWQQILKETAFSQQKDMPS